MACKNSDTCLQKAHPNEPLFVLRAQDASIIQMIGYWLFVNSQVVGTPKGDEAIALIEEIKEWQKNNLVKIAD